MSNFYRILEEMATILKNKGYDEKSLDSPDREGTMLKKIQYNLSYAIKNSLLDEEIKDFQVKTAGFFNDCKDLMIYTLDFEFDPKRGALDISKLTLFDGKDRREIPIANNDKLPSALDGFKLIQEQVKVLKNRNAKYIVISKSEAARRHTG